MTDSTKAWSPRAWRPHEIRFLEQAPSDLREELVAASRLYETTMDALGQQGIQVDCTLSKFVVRTLALYLAKATKTYRAIELTATAGLRTEVAAQSRTLFEILAIVRFIRQGDNPTGSAAMVWAHYFEQNERMVRSWKSSPVLRDTVEPDLLDRHSQSWLRVRAQVPEGVDYGKHWSGCGGLAAVCRLLGLGDWYDTMFRQTSQNVHSVDMIQHLDLDDNGDWLIDFEPSADGLVSSLRWSSILFWSVATEVLEAIGSSIDLSHVKPSDAKPTSS